VIATATVPLKPFTAVARTLIGEPIAPAVMVNDAGEIVSEKSGGGGAAPMANITVAE
jgi:hypothetical protein